jgi:hypothetical protein
MRRSHPSKLASSKPKLSLSVLSERLAVCRFERDSEIPSWLNSASAFFSVTRTSNELSVVCEETLVPADARAKRGWRALRVNGVLDLSLTGILVSLLEPLAAANLSVFAISTYETDYLLVKSEKLSDALRVLNKFCRVGGWS